MTKYARVAVRAAIELSENNCSAAESWSRAAEEVFTKGSAGYKKGCPRNAFLGLCEAGLIVGMSLREKPPERDNGRYAIIAARLLREEPALAANPKAEIWRRVMVEAGADPNKQHNAQLDVVLGLRDAGLLR